MPLKVYNVVVERYKSINLQVKFLYIINMFTLYKKGSHIIKVIEDGEKATIKGLGSMDSIELMILLIGNGYQIVR